MQYRSDIVPIIGMNTDSDPRHYEPGDYKEARNVRVGNPQDQGYEGLVQTLKSTSQYSIPDLGVGDTYYEYLGVAVDEENDRAYILALIEDNSIDYKFVIYKHDILTDTVKIIFVGDADDWGIEDITGRDQQYYYNPRIIDGRLIWTDNKNDIRQINVEKMERTWDAGIYEEAVFWNAIYANSPGYLAGDIIYYRTDVYEVLQNTVGVSLFPDEAPAYYDSIEKVVNVYLDPVDPNNFTLAALPSLLAITAQYLPDTTRNVNQLKGKTWQFALQYVYMDYRKSTYSPPSLVAPPSQEEKINGEPVTDPSVNNRIRLTLNTGNEQVRYINIVARTSEDPSTWFEVERVMCVDNNGSRVKGAGLDITVDFYNDKSGSAVESAEVYNLFSYVPITAKHMEVIEGNRLAFANITEGYSRIAQETTIELSWESLSGITTQKTWLGTGVEYRFDSYPDVYEYQLTFYMPTVNPGACTFRIGISFDRQTDPTYVQYVYNGTDSYPSTVIVGLQNAVSAQWGGNEIEVCFNPWTYKFCLFGRYGTLDWDPYQEWWVEFHYEKTTITDVNKYPCLKTGATHSWGTIYRDIVGRITPVIGAGEMTKYIPFPTEDTSSNVGRRALIAFKLNHLPPPQAVSYEIVYAGNKSVDWSLHLLGYNFNYGRVVHDDPASSSFSTTVYRLRVNKMQANTRNKLNNWSVEEYVWQKGDRVRVIGKVDASGILTEINDAIYDVEILAVYTDSDYENHIGDSSNNVESENLWIYFPKNFDITFVPNTGSIPNLHPDNLLIEIYRPFTTETNIFYTTGMTFPIKTDVYGNKIHGGDTDQVLNSNGEPVTPAIVNNTSHDQWKYLRNFMNVYNTLNFPLWVESDFASDFYLTNKLTSQGSPVPDIDFQQQNILTKRARHGGIIAIGSQVNNLADFDFDDYIDLKDEHGPIEGIRQVGFILKAIQYNKITSIYLNRLESYSASGSPQYLFTDKVFGSARPEMEDYGTAHPGSVTVNNRHLYFWDQSEGAVIRDAANGIIAISDYKMKRRFRDIAASLDAVAKKSQYVNFIFTKENDQLYCKFGTGTSQEIYTFSEKEGDQRWKTIIDINISLGHFYKMGKRLWHLNNGVLYEWWKGSNFLNIGGTTREGKLVFCSSPDPSKPVIFNAVIIYQDGATPVFGYVKVPERVSAVGAEMLTYIYPANIEEREGIYYCQILRDVNTPGPGTTNHKLVNGQELRGNYVEVELQFEGTTDPITLSNIIVLSTPSERSK